MADFPRIRWLNIDGQQVPFTEPQHFTGNGDETVRTGHDNPLPVANYTKKGNIWLPVSEENPVPTQVTGSNVEDGIDVNMTASNNVQSHLNREVVPAGSFITKSFIRFKGNRIGVNIRIDRSSNFKVGFQHTSNDSSLAVSREYEIISQTGTRGSGDFILLGGYGTLIIRNESEEDFEIVRLIVTDFMAGSGSQ